MNIIKKVPKSTISNSTDPAYTPVISYTTALGKTITFNNEQCAAVMAIQQWLKGNVPMYTLAGYAGTGKSSIVGYIIQHMRSVVVSAPTHKAKIVIERYTGKEGATIQSLLGLQPNTSLEHFDINNMQFDPIGTKLVSKYKLVVIDEASMLNEQLYNLLVTECTRYNTKILFMGDNAQLPPINEYESKVFSIDGISWLTKVERQSGDNPLMPIYDSIRNNTLSKVDVFSHINNTIDTNTGRQGVVYVDNNIFSNAVIEVFSSSFYKKDGNYCKILAYTNENVNKWNHIVRNAIIGEHTRIVECGDVLMSYNTISRNKQPVVYNSADYVVHSVSEHTDHRGINVYTTILQDIDTRKSVTVNILVPEADNIAKFSNIVQQIRKQAKAAYGKMRSSLWAQYYSTKADYLLMQPVGDIAKDIDYGYACTVHKSQGSTYNTVFVDEDNIDKNNNHVERNKLKYVAFSRPTHIVYSLYTGK